MSIAKDSKESMAEKKNTNSRIKIDPKRLYSHRDAAALLGIVPETVKRYCREGKKLTGKQTGPKREWMVGGASIKKLRKEWGLE